MIGMRRETRGRVREGGGREANDKDGMEEEGGRRKEEKEGLREKEGMKEVKRKTKIKGRKWTDKENRGREWKTMGRAKGFESM